MRSFPLAAFVVLCAACSNTLSGVVSDASTNTPDVPAARPDVAPDVAPDRPVAGPCRWRAGEAVVLPRDPADRSRRALLDLVPAEGGAWVLTSDDAGGGRDLDTTLERLDATGHRRPNGAVRLESIHTQRASLAVDEALGRRAVLEEAGGTGSTPCFLSLLDPAGALTARREVTFPRGGFSLAGCRGLMANRAGWTFLSEQIRALWGVSMVQLDPMGQTPMQPAPSVYDGFPEVAYARFALSERSFMLLWHEAGAQGAPPYRLRVQHFTEDAAPLAEPYTFHENPSPLRGFLATPAGDGAMALWAEPVDLPPRTYHVAVRALERGGRPRAPTRVLSELGAYQGGLSAAHARGDILATAISGSGVLRPVVIPLGPDGSPRGALVPIPTPPGTVQIGEVRIVPTPAGALVVYTTDPMVYPNRVVAVPLGCAP